MKTQCRVQSKGSYTVQARHIGPDDVAVIVPVGGSVPNWNRCAESLACLDPAPGEIVVVLDGPNDDLAATAAEIDATVVVLEERGGPARARNRGAQIVDGDILLFVDADVEVRKDLVLKVAGLFTEHQDVAAVIGSYDDAPGDPSFLSRYRNLLHHFVHQSSRETAATFWSGCGAMRCSVFREVGGFDEGYPDPAIEDIELGSRLLRAGHSIRLVKDLQVKHLKTWRLVDMLTTDLWSRAVPWTELILREKKMINDLNVKTRDRFSVVLAFVLLGTISVSWFWPPLLAVAAGTVVLLGAVNIRLLRFYWTKLGFLGAVGIAPLYWTYLLTCGFGFGIGFFRHLLRGRY